MPPPPLQAALPPLGAPAVPKYLDQTYWSMKRWSTPS